MVLNDGLNLAFYVTFLSTTLILSLNKFKKKKEKKRLYRTNSLCEVALPFSKDEIPPFRLLSENSKEGPSDGVQFVIVHERSQLFVRLRRRKC